ncbi:ALF repeat-containing protein [Streptomyces sp. C10-9-1]|uniref:ALF repeat-containing protein n=1 Tax=Streptomyces sp. C10-9-1 TaxID=1859285 RepID=UPI002111F7C3|nr:ALF repeat-containing protein [Streptomyces sp. C10-9-1]MCQ6553857.1 ALF repeat-containing protein [Streptomyces sp. C10-9-1]
MKLSRIAAVVTTAALAPAILIASPAVAAGEEAANGTPTAPTAPDQAASDEAGQDQIGKDQAEQDRKTILAIIADPMASRYMKEAGHQAIADGPAAMRAFIETDQHRIRLDDYRVLVTRLVNGAGPALRKGVNELLDNRQATLEELRHFHEVTQHQLRDQDNRVEITRLISTGGPGVKEAGGKALLGTPADRTAFLETGRYLAQASDDRAELARIDEAWDGPLLSGAIGRLLKGSPTPAELRHFLEVTQYELRDQDNRAEIARIVEGGGPELAGAGRAALAGTAADRTAFLEKGQHVARAKDTKAQREKDEKARQEKDASEGGQVRNEDRQEQKSPATGPGTGATPGTGSGTVAPQGGSGSLAATGAGDSAAVAGAAGTALVAGAGLLLAARMRRSASRG